MKKKALTFMLLLVILITSSKIAVPQNAAINLDSLEMVAAKAINIEQRIDALNKLSINFQVIDSKKALGYARTAIILSMEIKDTTRLLKSANELMIQHNMLGEFGNVISFYDSLVKIIPVHKHGKYLGALINNYGAAAMQMGKSEIGIQALTMAMEIFEESNDIRNYASPVFLLAGYYIRSNQYEKAEELLLKAEKKIRENNVKEYICPINLNLSNLYESMGLFDKALKNLEVARKHIDSENMYEQLILNKNFSSVYIGLGKSKEAIEYGQKALNYSKILNARNEMAKMFYTLSVAYEKSADYKSAFNYYKRFRYLNDSITNENNTEAIDAIMSGHIQEMQKIKDLYKLEKTRIMIQGIIIIAVIFSILIFSIYWYKKIIQGKNLVLARIIRRNILLQTNHPIQPIDVQALDGKILTENNSEEKPTEKVLSSAETKSAKESSNLNAELIAKIHYKFLIEKYYLNQNISLGSTATEIGTNRTYLSETINQFYKLSFSEFVNKLRIKDFIEKVIKDGKTHNIIQVSEECGFSSYSNFRKAFKKETGMTTSEFFKSHQNNQIDPDDIISMFENIAS